MKYEYIASSARADRRDDEAHVVFQTDTKKVAGEVLVIDGLEWTVEEVKRIWSEDEIKDLVQTNDKVLYGALRKIYAEQTADEQASGETNHQNGAGFNGVDAPILTSFCQFLEQTGFLTPKQRAIARKRLVKYNKQLTRLANA